ncbi:MAG: flagellar hook-basal body complex protein FliE [Phycisphaerales bacterium]
MADPLGLINSGVGGAGGAMRGIGGAGLTPRVGAGGGASLPQEEGGASFKDVLMQNLQRVNQMQQDAAKSVEDLVTNQRDDVETVLMATQQADAAFKMLQAVRNKMMEAYEEIKQMRV